MIIFVSLYRLVFLPSLCPSKKRDDEGETWLKHLVSPVLLSFNPTSTFRFLSFRFMPSVIFMAQRNDGRDKFLPSVAKNVSH